MKNRLASNLIFTLSFLVIAGALVMAALSIYRSNADYRRQEAFFIGERLKAQAKDWNLLLDYYFDLNNKERAVRRTASNVALAGVKSADAVIRNQLSVLKEDGKALSEEKKAALLRHVEADMSKEDGYLWVLDNKGGFIFPRPKDRTSISSLKDSKGGYVAQDLLAKVKALKQSDYVSYSYIWKSEAEVLESEKISSFAYIKELNWIVGFSVNYDDFVDRSDQALESIKDMMASQRIGKTGYVWVVDSNGNYQVSKNRTRDGENILNSRDEDGHFFIRDSIRTVKASNGLAEIAYPWKNDKEDKVRLKAAGLAYNKNLDWIIGVSAYYDDFEGTGLPGVPAYLILVMLVLLLSSLILIKFHVDKKLGPLAELADASRELSLGNLEAEIPVIETGDELEEVADAMRTLSDTLKKRKSVIDKRII